MISQFKLPNNLRVIHIPRPGTGLVSVSFMGKAGSMFEQDDEIGVAHFLEHVVFDGSKEFETVDQLSHLVEGVGGRRQGLTNYERVQYWVKVPSESLEKAFIYISQVTQFPLLRPVDIEKHKAIIEQEINKIEGNPERTVNNLALASLFSGQRLGTLNTGRVEDIKKITREKLISFMKRQYIASHFILTICGDYSLENITQLAEKYFGQMPDGKVIDYPIISPALKEDQLSLTNQNLKQLIVQHTYPGFVQYSKEAYCLWLINIVLGAGKLSRLHKKIRDEYSLAYTIKTTIVTGFKYGIFTIETGIDPKNLNVYLSVIDSELQKIMTVEITKDELDRVKLLARSSLLFRFEDCLEMATYYGYNNLNSQNLITHIDIVNKINSLTSADIMSVAKIIFSQPKKVSMTGPTT